MNWIEQHREIWAAKPALRHYYENEIFDRIVSRMPKGRCLEIGTGPGFFSGYSGNVVSIDVEFDRQTVRLCRRASITVSLGKL